jgi:putative phosphoribosyl transferase
MAGLADRVVCLMQPELFVGVGEWYQDFRQTSDAEVGRLLAAAARSDVSMAGVAGGC